jgi:transcriptional regulator with XRE-family HTH domain
MNDYLQRAGATFRSLMNDLKRNEETAAKELGVEVSLIEQIVAGVHPIPFELIQKMVRVWPVNERDFFPLHDDAPDGVIVMREEDSAATARVLQRGGKKYYEYRDTAMSRMAMIRPEWIRILHHVNDSDPQNPTIEWNNGHFLYQFTYFVGEVNYYYEFAGTRRCIPMVSGDSVFGLPFSRHTFATRTSGAPGLILALTYSGRLFGDPQHELGVLGAEKARKFVLETGTRRQARAALLAMHAQNGSYSAAYLAQQSALSLCQVHQLLKGEDDIDEETVAVLAKAMRIPARELAPVMSDTEDGIVINRGEHTNAWLLPDDIHPAYRLKELATSCVTPFSKALEVDVLRSKVELPFFLEMGLHEYGYQLGPNSILLDWCDGNSSHSAILRPGDSFYIRPFVSHSFRLTENTEMGAAHLLILRVASRVAGDTLLEASILGTESMHRIAGDNKCWYDVKGAP